MLIKVLISEVLQAVPMDFTVFWDMTPWSQMITDVSEESAAYISTLKMEAVGFLRNVGTTPCHTHKTAISITIQRSQ
jgi:hypothetical protein